MPLYDYHCNTCNHTFEVLQGRDAPGPKQCPQCQAEHPQKMLSAGNFHLKGGGWYVTDFKDKKKPDTEGNKSDVSKDTKTTTSNDDKQPAAPKKDSSSDSKGDS